MIVFRGTSSFENFIDGLKMANGETPSQYKSAKELYNIMKEVKKDNPKIIFH